MHPYHLFFSIYVNLSFTLDTLQMGSVSKKELQERHLPQLETCIQRDADDVRNVKGELKRTLYAWFS